MAAIEQNRDHLDRAIEYLSKAPAIAMSHSPKGPEGAQISHSLAFILSAAPDQHHNETTGHYFERSLHAYWNSVGPHDPAFLAAQDNFCRYVLINGQQECLNVQSVLYGPQQKKTKVVQKAVDMLARAPEVAERQQRHSRGKDKKLTHFQIPSSAKDV